MHGQRSLMYTHLGQFLWLLRHYPLVNLQTQRRQVPASTQDVVPAGGEGRARRKEHGEHLSSGFVHLLQGRASHLQSRLCKDKKTSHGVAAQRSQLFTLTRMSEAETSTVRDSSSGARSSLPTSKPASSAAPTAMTSSGGAELRSSTSGNMSRIICCRRGILAEPPHRTT